VVHDVGVCLLMAGLVFALAELGGDFNGFFKGGDARVVGVAEQFATSMTTIDEETRKVMVMIDCLGACVGVWVCGCVGV